MTYITNEKAYSGSAVIPEGTQVELVKYDEICLVEHKTVQFYIDIDKLDKVA